MDEAELRVWLEGTIDIWLGEYKRCAEAGHGRDASLALATLEAYRSVLGELDRQAYIRSRAAT